MLVLCDLLAEKAEVSKRLGALFVYADITQPYDREGVMREALRR